MSDKTVLLTRVLSRDICDRYITGYLVEKSEALCMWWQIGDVTQDLQITVPHLVEGTEYMIWVCAQNEQEQHF